MKKMFEAIVKGSVALVIMCFVSTSASFAKEADSIKDAFKGGKISGTIGNYTELVYAEASNSDHGWSSGYLTLKYETLSYNRFKFGARFFAHGDMLSKHDDKTKDSFEADIESTYTLAEAYLSYGFGENSSATVGRWNHKKVSHIDDAQSEGGYITIKEIKNLDFTFGAMRSFAEIDYDDSEDFGRTGNSQDLNSDAAYGADSGDYLYFLEVVYKPFGFVKLNPYFMSHEDYASVFGIDVKINAESEQYKIKFGGAIKYVKVNAEIAGSSDANVFAIQPFITKGPVKVDFSYSKFDDGNSLNHPGWLVDKFSIVDQNAAENNTDAEVFECRIKSSWGKGWVSYTYATATYATSAKEGDGYTDNELQVGYKISKALDINLRYFIVAFDNIVDKDYNKVESRVRFKF